jgi:small-conductance mechanosensitive channel
MTFSPIATFYALVPHWLTASAIVIATAIAALLLFRALRLLLRRIVKFDYPILHAIMARAETLLRYTFALLAVAVVTPLLPLDAASAGTVNRIVVAAVVVLMGWVALVASDLAIERYASRFRIDSDDNLLARKAVTQIQVLKRGIQVLIILVTAGFALMTFDSVRQYGVSLFASAGVAGLAIGLAAKPLLGNLIAGIQIALTQPIRIDDAVVVEGEWGWIEEFTSTYVVVRLWDWRRLIVPLGYFLEHPFQNWTRTTSSIIGTVFFHLDHLTPVEAVRSELERLAKASALWDGQVVSLQVTDSTERTIEVRALVSARNSSLVFDLRCDIREKMLAFLREQHPLSLPRLRADLSAGSVDPVTVEKMIRQSPGVELSKTRDH